MKFTLEAVVLFFVLFLGIVIVVDLLGPASPEAIQELGNKAKKSVYSKQLFDNLVEAEGGRLTVINVSEITKQIKALQAVEQVAKSTGNHELLNKYWENILIEQQDRAEAKNDPVAHFLKQPLLIKLLIAFGVLVPVSLGGYIIFSPNNPFERNKTRE